MMYNNNGVEFSERAERSTQGLLRMCVWGFVLGHLFYDGVVAS